MGLLTNSDSEQFRDWFNEMSRLRGINVGYQYPLSDTKTLHSEPNMPMSNPIQLDIIFNENPTVDTLKKHGWVTEIGENKPVVAQVPYNTPNLQRYSRIIIPPIGTVIKERTFEVTAISTILEYPDCWTVKLAPVYNTIVEEHNESLNNANVSMMDVITEGSQDGLHENKSKEFSIYDFPDGKIVNPEPSLKEKIDNSGEKESIDNVLGKNFDDFDD